MMNDAVLDLTTVVKSQSTKPHNTNEVREYPTIVSIHLHGRNHSIKTVMIHDFTIISFSLNNNLHNIKDLVSELLKMKVLQGT